MLAHKLIIFLGSLRLPLLSIPSPSLIQTGETVHRVSPPSAPGYKVAVAALPSTVVLLTWAVLSSHRDLPPPLLATTSLEVADHDDSPLYPSFPFAPTCSTGSYDGPDESLWLVNGKCDNPYFVESPKPILVKPSTLAWPTCSLAAYDGTDFAIHGAWDPEFPFFPLDLSTPRHPLDAQTARTTLLLCVPGSLASDPCHMIDHLSDRILDFSRRFLVSLDTICSDLDWPVMSSLSGLVSNLVGASVSRIWSLFDKAQAFKHLADPSGNEYWSLLTQDLLETARQRIGPIITLCPPSKLAEVLRAEVDWIVISLRSDLRQVIDHLSDRPLYFSRRFLVSLDTVCSDLDWPIMHSLFGLVSNLVGASVSRIWSLFDKAQAFKHLVDSFGHEDRSLLETARQTIGFVITLGYGLSGFLLDIVGQIPLLCPPSELAGALRAKVDWIAILPLLRCLALLFLGVAISFYVGYRRLQVSYLFFSTFGVTYIIYHSKLQRYNREAGPQGADVMIRGTIVRLSFYFITLIAYYSSSHRPRTPQALNTSRRQTWSMFLLKKLPRSPSLLSQSCGVSQNQAIVPYVA